MAIATLTARVVPGLGATTIALTGELDIATVLILEEHLSQVDAYGATAITVDPHQLTFMGSEGLHAFPCCPGTGRGERSSAASARGATSRVARIRAHEYRSPSWMTWMETKPSKEK
jgi:hypothetical protein